MHQITTRDQTCFKGSYETKTMLKRITHIFLHTLFPEKIKDLFTATLGKMHTGQRFGSLLRNMTVNVTWVSVAMASASPVSSLATLLCAALCSRLRQTGVSLSLIAGTEAMSLRWFKALANRSPSTLSNGSLTS